MLILPGVGLPATVTGGPNGSSCSPLGILWWYPAVGIPSGQYQLLVPVPKLSVCAGGAVRALHSMAVGQCGHSKAELLASLARGHCGET